MPGVDIAADAEQLPFADAVFQRVECDAVLEHVRDPVRVAGELRRVLAPGGYLHLVTPFCHPFHEYPKDYRRFTLDGLKQLAGDLEVVAEGWRTGPTATLLVVGIEYVKGLLPWRWWRGGVHFALGWLLFPLRYLDLPLLRTGARRPHRQSLLPVAEEAAIAAAWRYWAMGRPASSAATIASRL